jgi:hypothetical protein
MISQREQITMIPPYKRKKSTTKKGINAERIVTYGTNQKQMVQSRTRRQQEERKQLARNVKGKIMLRKK